MKCGSIVLIGMLSVGCAPESAESDTGQSTLAHGKADIIRCGNGNIWSYGYDACYYYDGDADAYLVSGFANPDDCCSGAMQYTGGDTRR